MNNEFQRLTKEFRWTTMQGQSLSIDQMTTSHLFNTFKMMFNHLAANHGLDPVWFSREYEACHEKAREIPEELAKRMVLFMMHIEKRNDLPEKYKVPYQAIKSQLLKRYQIQQAQKSLLEKRYLPRFQ